MVHVHTISHFPILLLLYFLSLNSSSLASFTTCPFSKTKIASYDWKGTSHFLEKRQKTFATITLSAKVDLSDASLKLADIRRSIFSQKNNDDDEKQTGEKFLEELGLRSSIEPKTFNVPPSQLWNVLTSSFLPLMRAGSGVFALGYDISIIPKDDAKYTIASLGSYQLEETCSYSAFLTQKEPLLLYEFESSPYCRLVREAICMLSLDVTYKPCPKNGMRYRRSLMKNFGSNCQFPFLIDSTTGVEMSGYEKIISYLFKTYGDGNIPWTLRLGNNDDANLPTLTAKIGLSPRFGSGGTYLNSKAPSPQSSQPLILWSYEGSPFCKVVRETMSSLELCHTQISCPRGGLNRQRMFDEVGRFQVPYLEDPNTGVKLFESSAIVEYLNKVYGVGPTPVEYL